MFDNKNHHNTTSPTECSNALQRMSPNCNRDDWLKIAMGLKDGLGDAGFQLFDRWSQGGTSYDANACRTMWRSIKPGGGITIRTFFKMARDAGWHPVNEQPTPIFGPRPNPNKAVTIAHRIMAITTPTPNDHPYLVKKGVHAVSTLREITLGRLVETIGYQPKSKYGALQGDRVLVVPIHNATNNQQTSLGFIDPEGRKHFLCGGLIAGCCWTTESPPKDDSPGLHLLLGEGIATVLSAVKALPGSLGVAALMNSNLPAITSTLRQKYPTAHITILADIQKNNGLADPFSIKAAQDNNTLLAIPDFGANHPVNHTDFNDLHRVFGLNVVREQILAARPVAPNNPKQQTDKQTEQACLFRCLADIQAEPIQWLWPGRIAKRKLTLQAGDPGLGKSQVTLSLAATVTIGGTWPDGTKYNTPGNVLIISIEDDPSDTIKPRLEACGADMNRIFILEAVLDTNYKGKKTKRSFNLQDDIIRLESLITQIGGTDLIIIDPISAYVGKSDSYKNSDVRALLGPLSDLAARHDSAVIAVSHLAKSGANAINKFSGSLGFIAAARAGFLIAKDPKDNNRRLFLPVKNNIGSDATGFAYHIHPVTLASGIETSRVLWEPETVSVTADQAVVGLSANPEENSLLDEAKEFLREHLERGQVEAQIIFRDARCAGISETTLRRAKAMLGIKPKKIPHSGKWHWKLPDSTSSHPS